MDLFSHASETSTVNLIATVAVKTFAISFVPPMSHKVLAMAQSKRSVRSR
jgi:hypothetical protein